VSISVIRAGFSHMSGNASFSTFGVCSVRHPLKNCNIVKNCVKITGWIEYVVRFTYPYSSNEA